MVGLQRAVPGPDLARTSVAGACSHLWGARPGREVRVVTIEQQYFQAWEPGSTEDPAQFERLDKVGLICAADTERAVATPVVIAGGVVSHDPAVCEYHLDWWLREAEMRTG